MSTRSVIGKLNSDNTVTFIYCHFDGYPNGVGKTLKQHYQDENKINQLLELGDLSYLGKEIGYEQDFNDRSTHVDGFCLAYGRDRKKTDTEAQSISIEKYLSENMCGENYKYLYNDQWECYIDSSLIQTVI